MLEDYSIVTLLFDNFNYVFSVVKNLRVGITILYRNMSKVQDIKNMKSLQRKITPSQALSEEVVINPATIPASLLKT